MISDSLTQALETHRAGRGQDNKHLNLPLQTCAHLQHPWTCWARAAVVSSTSSQPTDAVRGWASHLQAHFFAYQLIATKGCCAQRPGKSPVSSQQMQPSAWNKPRRNSPELRFVLKWEASPGIAGLTALLWTLDMALGIPAWLCGCSYLLHSKQQKP